MTYCAFCDDAITWFAYHRDGRDFCDALCFKEARKLRNQVERDFRETAREKRLQAGR